MDVLLGPQRPSLALTVLSLLFNTESSDSSSPLSFSSSLSSNTIIFRTVKYEILESITFELDLCSIFDHQNLFRASMCSVKKVKIIIVEILVIG